MTSSFEVPSAYALMAQSMSVVELRERLAVLGGDAEPGERGQTAALLEACESALLDRGEELLPIFTNDQIDDVVDRALGANDYFDAPLRWELLRADASANDDDYLSTQTSDYVNGSVGLSVRIEGTRLWATSLMTDEELVWQVRDVTGRETGEHVPGSLPPDRRKALDVDRVGLGALTRQDRADVLLGRRMVEDRVRAAALGLDQRQYRALLADRDRQQPQRITYCDRDAAMDELCLRIPTFTPDQDEVAINMGFLVFHRDMWVVRDGTVDWVTLDAALAWIGAVADGKSSPR